MSCIHSAALGGHYHLVESLLQDGVAVDLRDADFETPLNLAAKMGFINIVKLLVSHGADQQLRNKDGVTAILWAMMENHLEVVNFLMTACGADVLCSDQVRYQSPYNNNQAV